jgi:hypothetical protein
VWSEQGASKLIKVGEGGKGGSRDEEGGEGWEEL